MSPAARNGARAHDPAYDVALAPEIAERVTFDERGLVCAVVQEENTGEILMVAYLNDQALALTLSSGRAWYYSRSRNELWRKGDTSGNIQQVVSLAYDCDGDALVMRVRQRGPACHTGTRTCFTGRELPLARKDDDE